MANRRDDRRDDGSVVLAGVRPLGRRRPVGVVVNPGAGTGDGELELPAHVIRRELGEGDDLQSLLRGLADECAIVGMAGGDGSVGCAAGVAMERDVALWPAPGGTLNHFARTVGFVDMAAALDGLRGGRAAQVDVAEVDGTVFVNNASIGAYGEMVRRRERLQRRLRLGKWFALALAAGRTLRRATPIAMDLDGRPERLYLLFVGNNRYDGDFGLGGRASLQEGVLDIMALRAQGRLPRLGIVWDILLHRLPRSSRMARWTAPELEVALHEGTALAHDGEARNLEPGRLVFRSRPAAVRVIVP